MGRVVKDHDSSSGLRGIFVYPDPVTGPEMINGAAFLYFNDPIILTTPPTVLNEEPYALLDLIENRRPSWGRGFSMLLDMWSTQQDSYIKIRELFKPLGEKVIQALFVYPADITALEEAGALVESSAMSKESIKNLINIPNAAGEIVRHIMVEAFLEKGEDVGALFEYCGSFFRDEQISHLLVRAYFLRLLVLKRIYRSRTPLLLNNPDLAEFFTSLPVESQVDEDDTVDIDMIAWELFRQILSSHLDPLNSERVKLIAKLLSSRSAEIDGLRSKCLFLAEQCLEPVHLEQLTENVEKFIKVHVNKEIKELLELDRKSLENFFIALFSDEKTWIAMTVIIAGILHGNVPISAGAAIAAVSTVGAKAFKEAAERHRKIRESDYALVYTISRRCS